MFDETTLPDDSLVGTGGAIVRPGTIGRRAGNLSRQMRIKACDPGVVRSRRRAHARDAARPRRAARPLGEPARRPPGVRREERRPRRRGAVASRAAPARLERVLVVPSRVVPGRPHPPRPWRRARHRDVAARCDRRRARGAGSCRSRACRGLSASPARNRSGLPRRWTKAPCVCPRVAWCCSMCPTLRPHWPA